MRLYMETKSYDISEFSTEELYNLLEKGYRVGDD